MHYVGRGRQLLKFTCLQPRPITVLNMLMPLAVCGLLTLAVGLVLTIGADAGRPPPQPGALLSSVQPRPCRVAAPSCMLCFPCCLDWLVWLRSLPMAGSEFVSWLRVRDTPGSAVSAGPADPSEWSWIRGEVSTVAQAPQGGNASVVGFYNLWQQARCLVGPAATATLCTIMLAEHAGRLAKLCLLAGAGQHPLRV